MFQINDTILYGTQGVCRIEGFTEKVIDGKTVRYYILKPVYQSNSTVYVPVDNEKLTSKMRPMLTVDEIHELINTMPDEETIWITDNMARKEKYRQIIASGDRKLLVQLIKTLYNVQVERQKEGKKLHQSDEIFFKKAENLLYNEFALALDIRPEQVVPFLRNEIGVDALLLKEQDNGVTDTEKN